MSSFAQIHTSLRKSIVGIRSTESKLLPLVALLVLLPMGARILTRERLRILYDAAKQESPLIEVRQMLRLDRVIRSWKESRARRTSRLIFTASGVSKPS